MKYEEIHDAFKKKFPDLAKIETNYKPAMLPSAIKVWLNDDGNCTQKESYIIFQMYGKHDEGKILGYKNYYEELWNYIFSQGDISKKAQQKMRNNFDDGDLLDAIDVLEKYMTWSNNRDKSLVKSVMDGDKSE